MRERYAAAARQAQGQLGAGCCGSDCCAPGAARLYNPEELEEVPEGAALASLGCGNPTLLAELRPGETVLDLGSGGGIDVLLSARRVGPTGLAYGLDMTDEMLALAERNRAAAGAENARFLKGHLEAIPLPEAAVDVLISNCVINLSGDKPRVLREAFRVLRPGGRFAVSDIVLTGPLPEEVLRDPEAWSGCVAGALPVEEYRRLLAAAGFADIEVRITRTYAPGELRAYCGRGDAAPVDIERSVASAFVRARKPAPAP